MSFQETGRRFETSDNMPTYMKSVQLYDVLTKDEELDLGRRIQAGIRTVNEQTVLTPDANAALGMLVCANLRYVVQQANKFIGQGVSIDDLIEEGNEALITAAKRYDPSQNKKFITFAHFYLQKAFNLANGTFGKIVRLPQNQEYDIYKRRMAGEDINTHTVQLDRPIGESGENTLGDLILREDPTTDIERDHDRFRVTVMMNRLDDVSKAIITKRFGLNGNSELTLKEISEDLNIPQGLVNRKYKEALETMRPRAAR